MIGDSLLNSNKINKGGNYNSGKTIKPTSPFGSTYSTNAVKIAGQMTRARQNAAAGAMNVDTSGGQAVIDKAKKLKAKLYYQTLPGH